MKIKTEKTAVISGAFASVLLTILYCCAVEANPGLCPHSTRDEPICYSHGQNTLSRGVGLTLRCRIQNTEAQVGIDGLWLASTQPGKPGRVHVIATSFWRDTTNCVSGISQDIPVQPIVRLAGTGCVLPGQGTIRFIRPDLIEEYSVTPEGIRQDFIITRRIPGQGELCVELTLSGATALQTCDAAKFILNDSGRELNYGRLHVNDATGRKLSAQLHVTNPNTLLVRLDDTDAVYPIRIDPTISDADWDTRLSPGCLGADIVGMDAAIYAIAAESNGDLYAGGLFEVIGSTVAQRIAKWDGTNWTPLGIGVSAPVADPCVRVITKIGSELYVGGSFCAAGGVEATNIAKWDGQQWTALGCGLGDHPKFAVCAVASFQGIIYAAGMFTRAVGEYGGWQQVNHIAKWNGTTWSGVGGGLDGPGFALAVVGQDLYVGGSFTNAGGIRATNIARWDGTNWSAVGLGIGGPVSALTVIGTTLYVGGVFSSAGGIPATNIAKWDGTNWSPVGHGFNGPVYALCNDGAVLYAGGSFTATGDLAATNIAKWDGTNWSAIGLGVNGPVYVLAATGTSLYAGGAFTVASGKIAKRIARWDGTKWSPMGVSGVDNVVRALAVAGTNLYIGGGFSKAGAVSAKRIAKWDGTKWSALGSGMNMYWVHALAVDGTNLYAGGSFTNAGGVSANRIAKWDGKSWSPLGAGMNNTVYALAVGGGNLYAGGDFTMADGQPANHVAKWDGNKWSPLGEGTDARVHALAVSGNALYAGGIFLNAGGIPARYVAKWDGTNWSALGSGVSATVRALILAGNELYAGGRFDWAGDLRVNNIARWDGSNWYPLGSGVDVAVYALAKYGTDIYAAGFFTQADGIPVSHIAKWDGKSWSPVGSGVNFWVYALATDEFGRLFVAGDFLAAAGKAAPYIAQVYLTPEGGVLKAIHVNNDFTTLNFVGRPSCTYEVQRATDPAFSEDLTIILVTNAPASCAVTFTDTNPPRAKAFYRLVRQQP